MIAERTNIAPKNHIQIDIRPANFFRDPRRRSMYMIRAQCVMHSPFYEYT